MQSPARQRDRFPIPTHSSGFPAPALNIQLLTINSLLTPLFVALPSISRLNPLSTAFTHFDGGVGVAFHFFRPLPIYPSCLVPKHTLHFVPGHPLQLSGDAALDDRRALHCRVEFAN
jgi:hypothetical protein